MSASTHGHDPALKHHFDNLEQQHSAERLGMWFFLVTEVLFFSGMFVAYTAYRNWYPAEFGFASNSLIVWIAGVNTGLLITSSLTVTLAIRAAQLGNKAALTRHLVATFLLGAGFMGFKAYEYATDIHEGLVPGVWFREEYQKAVDELAPVGHAAVKDYKFTGGQEHWAQDLARLNHGKHEGSEGYVSPGRVQLFLCFYWTMTGIHGVHILAGLGCLGWLIARAARGGISKGQSSHVEVVSLYWHLVDMIWLFLMPLLYLAGTKAAGH